jgi:hypothetical protein
MEFIHYVSGGGVLFGRTAGSLHYPIKGKYITVKPSVLKASSVDFSFNAMGSRKEIH